MAEWRDMAIYRTGSTLVQVMACCLTAPSHYLNQYWLIITEVGPVRGISQEIHQPSITIFSLKILFYIFIEIPWGQWLNSISKVFIGFIWITHPYPSRLLHRHCNIADCPPLAAAIYPKNYAHGRIACIGQFPRILLGSLFTNKEYIRSIGIRIQ